MLTLHKPRAIVWAQAYAWEGSWRERAVFSKHIISTRGQHWGAAVPLSFLPFFPALMGSAVPVNRGPEYVLPPPFGFTEHIKNVFSHLR